MNKLLFIFLVSWLIIPIPTAFSKANMRVPLPAILTLHKVNALLGKEKSKEALQLLLDFQDSGINSNNSTTITRRGKRQGTNHYLINFAIGNCHLQNNQIRKAIAKYEQVIRQNPDYKPVWINLAKSYYELSEYQKASDGFLTAYKLSKKTKADYLFFAFASLTAGNNPQKAYDLFLQLIKNHRKSIKTEWKESWVQILFTLKHQKEALPWIEEIAEEITGKKRKKWQEILLYHYVTLEMHKKASDYADWLVIDDPTEPKWWKGSAHCQLRKSNYYEALTALTVYSKLTKLSRQEKKLVAALNFVLAIPLQSIRLYEELVEEDTTPEIIDGLIRGYQRRHQPLVTLKWIDRSLELKENENLRLLKGNLLFELKKYDEAAHEFRLITQRNKNQGKAWLMLGYTAWKQKDRKGAYDALQQASTFPKQQKAALNVLKYLNRIP